MKEKKEKRNQFETTEMNIRWKCMNHTGAWCRHRHEDHTSPAYVSIHFLFFSFFFSCKIPNNIFCFLFSS